MIVPTRTHPPGDVSLHAASVSKTYGANRVVSEASLQLRSGTIHALLGPNGCGKSTLIKILAGVVTPDSGAVIEIGGHPVQTPLRPGEARSLGLAFVHQDLGLIDGLSVAENLRMPWLIGAGLSVSMRHEVRRAMASLERAGLHINPRVDVASLSRSERALVAVARSLDLLAENKEQRGASGVLFLDETTAFLPRSGAEALFRTARQFADEGGSVVFVSHDLDEAIAHADDITVLRDGQVVATCPSTDVDRDQLVRLIAGRDVSSHCRPTGPMSETVALTVTGLSGAAVEQVSLTVRAGEVVGLTGIIGSGYDDVLDLIHGAKGAKAGEIALGDRPAYDARGTTPARSVSSGIALVPADRPTQGVVAGLTIGENIQMQKLASRGRSWWLRVGAARKQQAATLQRFAVRPPVPHMAIENLSGGNQQKVVLGKWLEDDPAVLLLQEPTQGVDIGARAEIYRLIEVATSQGTAVLLASADHEELAQMCDRVLVMERGRVSAELGAAAATKASISAACMGKLIDSAEESGRVSAV